MSEAARLRAQKAYSTDPDYLERMALAEEAREAATAASLAAAQQKGRPFARPPSRAH
jgi:hypothetical protein